MEDARIIDLYWQRQEHAIDLTRQQYGAALQRFAESFLGNEEDGQECVNDTYLRAWNSIPPKRPDSLQAYLYKLLRSLCIDRFRSARAAKRGGCQYAASLEELQDCVAGGTEPEQELELKQLGQCIERYLSTLSAEQRQIFLRRYYFVDPIEEIGRDFGRSVSSIKSMLYRIRQGLKEKMKEEQIL